tara:strand:+ start:70 stop:300 length:231 start_codon:yes stop_codon:yes gene_type:complete
MNPEYFKALKNMMQMPRVGSLVRLSRALNGRLMGRLALVISRHQSPLEEDDYDEFDVLVDDKRHHCYRHEFDMVSK